MLVLKRNPKEAVFIIKDGEVVMQIVLVDAQKRSARLGFEAGSEYEIARDDALTPANKEAVKRYLEAPNA